MADQFQNPPLKPMPESEDMKEMITHLKCEINSKLVKFKMAFNNLCLFFGNKERFKRILNQCMESEAGKYLDEIQNRIAECSQYYCELDDLVNSDEWKKAIKHCEEMKNQNQTGISKWVGYGGLVVLAGVGLLSWPFGLISATTASIGVVCVAACTCTCIGGALRTSISLYYRSTYDSETLEKCEKAFRDCKTVQVHLEEIKDDMRRIWDRNDKKETKHTLKVIKRKITVCTAKMTEGNQPQENMFTNLYKTAKHGVKAIDQIFPRN